MKAFLILFGALLATVFRLGVQAESLRQTRRIRHEGCARSRANGLCDMKISETNPFVCQSIQVWGIKTLRSVNSYVRVPQVICENKNHIRKTSCCCPTMRIHHEDERDEAG